MSTCYAACLLRRGFFVAQLPFSYARFGLGCFLAQGAVLLADAAAIMPFLSHVIWDAKKPSFPLLPNVGMHDFGLVLALLLSLLLSFGRPFHCGEE